MITVRYLEKLNVVVMLGSGDVTVEQLFNAATQWRRDSKFSPDTSVVWDLVDARVAFDWDRTKEVLPSFVEGLKDSRKSESRTAWVISEDVEEIIIESIHLAFPWTTQWQVFRDAESAVAWATAKD